MTVTGHPILQTILGLFCVCVLGHAVCSQRGIFNACMRAIFIIYYKIVHELQIKNKTLRKFFYQQNRKSVLA